MRGSWKGERAILPVIKYADDLLAIVSRTVDLSHGAQIAIAHGN